MGKFNLALKTQTKKHKEPKRYKLNLEKLRNIDTQTLYENLIKQKIKGMQKDLTDLEIDDVEKNWSIYKKAITESANEVCEKKAIGGNKKRTAWWNDIVKLKVKEKKDAWKKYLATKSNEDIEAYKLKRKEAKDEVKKSKQQQWEIFGVKLEENFRENKKLFWGAVKRCRRGNQCQIKHVKNKEGDVIKDSDAILEVWRDYFEKLHNPNISYNVEMIENPSLNRINRLSDDGSANNNDEITMDELRDAKKKIKLGKAPGPDGIYPEMIVKQGIEGDKLMLKIFQAAFKTKVVPEDWTKSTIIPIHKSGSTMQCENYRGISLLSVPGKVYARILEKRLRTKVNDKLLEYQCGFRPDRSVQDHIHTLRQLSETTYRYDRKVHVCFIDLQKAFDSIKREELWKALKEHEVNDTLIEAIKSFYVNPKSTVQISGRTTNEFKVDVGVKQGCILSTLLLNELDIKAM